VALIDSELYKIALNACIKAYKLNTDLGTTEYWYSKAMYQDRPLQALGSWNSVIDSPVF
jgi:hypothetical protein